MTEKTVTPENQQDCGFREHYWSELKDKEKVERLRTVLKCIRDELAKLSSRCKKTERDFRCHEHSQSTSNPVVPVYDPQSRWENEAPPVKPHEHGDDCYI